MLDSLIIAAYFVVVLYIGIRSGRGIKNIKEFSIGDRNFSIPLLVAALSATLIGGGATFGVAEKTFRVGLIFPLAYCGICLSRFLEAFLIAKRMKPFFGLISAGDIMEQIYGKPAKILTGVATFTTSIFILGAHITTMGFLIHSMLGIPLNISLVIGTLTVLVYSGYGGIAAVSFTDVFQFVFMLVTIPLVCIIGLIDIGGLSAIKAAVPVSHLDIRTLNFDTLFDHGIIFLSYSLPALFPVIVQRMLMAKNERQIKLSLIINSILSAVFFFLVAIIGLIVVTKAPTLDPKMAFPYLINEMPIGVRGLIIAGLLAVIMSTVDSFLNLIGVTFTHDVLHPLMGAKLDSKKQLRIARITAYTVGIAGLLSAMYFDGILENIFASMNLWLPFIFPPLFLGIMGKSNSQTSFFFGIFAAFFTLMLFKFIGTSNIFSAGMFAATANGITLIVVTKLKMNVKFQISDSITSSCVTNYYNSFITKLKLFSNNFINQISSETKNNLMFFEIFGVFALFFTILPLLTTAGFGSWLTTSTMVVFTIISLISVFFILKDLWIEKPFGKTAINLWPLFLLITLSTQPCLKLISSELSVLSIINCFIGLITLFVFFNEKILLILAPVGVVFAVSIIYLLPSFRFESESPAQAMETLVRLLALTYFFVASRKKDFQKIEDYNTLNETMAHEIGHSIASMNFCAKRLRNTIPALLESYKINQSSNLSIPLISESNLKAIETLAQRLVENADRTENTVQIIQIKIGNEPLEASVSQKFFIHDVLNEALRSGSIESIMKDTKIDIQGKDFQIYASKGSIVHVVINLIKNSLEALIGIKNPNIIICTDPLINMLSITDNGIGISASQSKQIFSEEFTTKKHGKGKGLYFCKMIIEDIGGTISCDPRPNKTQFLIRFPALMEKTDDSYYEKEDSCPIY